MTKYLHLFTALFDLATAILELLKAAPQPW
jgi:hypothetical protein